MLRFAVTRIDGTFAQQSVDNAFNTDSDTEDSAPAPVGTGVPSATSHIKSLSMACFHLLEPLAKGATNAQTRGVAKTLHQTHAAGREFAARVEAKLASGALKGSHEEILAWQAGCNNLRINYAEGLRLYNHRFPDNVQTVERTIPYQKPPEKEESPIHVASSLPESTGIALPWGVGASRRRQNSGGGTASGGGGGSDTRPRANSASKTQRSLESTASSSSNMSTLYVAKRRTVVYSISTVAVWSQCEYNPLFDPYCPNAVSTGIPCLTARHRCFGNIRRQSLSQS